MYNWYELKRINIQSYFGKKNGQDSNTMDKNSLVHSPPKPVKISM